ncbi:MAG: Asp-tRNA(Asn)/Glu-tRNA(Gln) amidotransferase subunit GatA [Pseudomonadota bacterium]|nr:Asp-tRNA(Asn)/Glu-tRNA(Gln) amidotransferase subunit GatA [Pseudomonadota bacterium]
MINPTSSISEIKRDLDTKSYSHTELTEFFLDRIEKANKKLNCFITISRESALKEAAAADSKNNKVSSLFSGIPYANKDIFCTDQIRTTCGSRMLENFLPLYDAEIVGRAKSLGLIMLGKTNMDEFAMGSTNETSFFGAVRNPWDLTKVPGGSSGGSAVAVAAGLAPFATGSDTGGSIRQPAALCGVTGLKPTYGRISRFGMIAFASSLDQAGFITRTAEDCALCMEFLSDFDIKDSTSVDITKGDYVSELNGKLKGKKIGIPKEYFDKNLDPEIGQCLNEAKDIFSKLGCKLVDIELTSTEMAVASYYIIAPAECSSNLARFDGVKYGFRSMNSSDIDSLYKNTRDEGFGTEVKRRILIGTYALSSGYYDKYYEQAQRVRSVIRNDFKEAFKKVDVILGPTTPSTAFPLKNGAPSDPTELYSSDLYTIPVNLAGLPAISIPAGLSKQKLPIGMQLIGRAFNEHVLLNVAHQFQLHSEWHHKTPKFNESFDG